MKNKTIPAIRVPIMVPLLQGNFTPASCRAKISGIGQHTERMPPMPSKPLMRSEFDLPSFRLGIAKKINPIATTHIGPLFPMLASHPGVVMYTYFMKKIQRHVVRSAIMPPSNGPRRLDMVKTELIRPE